MGANVALCDRRAGATGLVLHALDSYDSGIRDAARRTFGFETPVAVEAVVPQSAAARAGVRADESVAAIDRTATTARSEEHTSELQSLMRISYADFCLKQKTKQ